MCRPITTKSTICFWILNLGDILWYNSRIQKVKVLSRILLHHCTVSVDGQWLAVPLDRANVLIQMTDSIYCMWLEVYFLKQEPLPFQMNSKLWLSGLWEMSWCTRAWRDCKHWCFCHLPDALCLTCVLRLWSCRKLTVCYQAIIYTQSTNTTLGSTPGLLQTMLQHRFC